MDKVRSTMKYNSISAAEDVSSVSYLSDKIEDFSTGSANSLYIITLTLNANPSEAPSG
jgi:hypothetical protein